MNEQIVLHRIYRECIDAVNDIWRRISFWTQASDVDLTQGETVQYRLDNLDLDSTNAKTLIENFIYDANEAHRTLQLQLDQLKDNLNSRMTTLRSRYETWKIVVGDDPELIAAYEKRLEEAESTIAGMIKIVEDEVARLQELLDGILAGAESDPLAKDILDSITTLRSKATGDYERIMDQWIGPGFNPDVQAIGPTITDALLAQEKSIYTAGAKFWEWYYFNGEEVVSSEDLDNIETVDYGPVIDLPYGSMVNIDYNRKLDICFVRGWLCLDSTDVYKTDIGEINLPNIFPKDTTVSFSPVYMHADFGSHFTVKTNRMIGTKKITFAPKTNGEEGYLIKWEGNYSTDKNGKTIDDYVNGMSDDFGDAIDPDMAGYPEGFSEMWVMFRGSYFDRGEDAVEEEDTSLNFASASDNKNGINDLVSGFNDYFYVPKTNTNYPIALSNHINYTGTEENKIAYYPMVFLSYQGDAVLGSDLDYNFKVIFNKDETNEIVWNMSLYNSSSSQWANNTDPVILGQGFTPQFYNSASSEYYKVLYGENYGNVNGRPRSASHISEYYKDANVNKYAAWNLGDGKWRFFSQAIDWPRFSSSNTIAATDLSKIACLYGNDLSVNNVYVEWGDGLNPNDFVFAIAFCFYFQPIDHAQENNVNPEKLLGFPFLVKQDLNQYVHYLTMASTDVPNDEVVTISDVTSGETIATARRVAANALGNIGGVLIPSGDVVYTFTSTTNLLNKTVYVEVQSGTSGSIIEIDTTRISVTGTLNASGSSISTYCFAKNSNTTQGNFYCVPSGTIISSSPCYRVVDEETASGSTVYCMINETTAASLSQYHNINVNLPDGYKIIQVTYDAKTAPSVNETETLTYG